MRKIVSVFKTFGIIIALIVAVCCLTSPVVNSASAQSSPVIIITPTPAATPTSEPTQSPIRNIELDYSEVSIDNSSRAGDFQLTFEFSTLQNNAHGQTPFTNYELVYVGSTTTASPSPTPTVPEFRFLAILPLLAVAPLIAAVLFRKKRS